MMVRLIALCSVALMMSACSTVLEKPYQNLKIELRGTGEALCDVNQEGRRYRAYAPSSIKIYKDSGPMKIKCEAPGNRALSVVIDPEMSAMTAANVANGIVPGVMWDYASGAAHKYPSRVIMDFSAMPPKPYDVPDYQKVFNKNPELYSMEEFRPGTSALQSDIGRGLPILPKREDGPSMESSVIGRPAMQDMSVESLDSPAAAPASVPDVPASSSTMRADDLTRMMNPQVFDGDK